MSYSNSFTVSLYTLDGGPEPVEDDSKQGIIGYD